MVVSEGGLMRTFTLREAHKRFAEIIEMAAKGEVVRIIRRGNTVAEVGPPEEKNSNYWKTVKPLKIGKVGLSRFLLTKLRQERRFFKK